MVPTEKHTYASGAPAQAFPIGSVDARIIGVMRCILALTALALVTVDTVQSPARATLTTAALFAYFLWSATSLVLATRGNLARPPRHEHWIDVAASAALISLAPGADGVFFFVLLFAILVSSFSWGFSEGLRVTCASVLGFALAGLVFAPDRAGFEPSVVRPFYLLTLGNMIAFWGGHEITHRRRLRLLQEISNQWNPRFGHDHAVGTNLQRAVDFFSAGACILVLKRPTTPPIYLTYHTSGGKRGQAMAPTAINRETATILLDFPSSFSARYDESPPWWRRWMKSSGLSPRDPVIGEQCQVLANLLDTRSFITVPYLQRDGTQGRVYLTVGKRRFVQDDVDFFAQLMTTISNVVEGMQLMDELVSRAAEHERYRISLDIHDTTIQPYIGLKLGLDALAREAGSDNLLSPRIGELLGMTDNTIRDLRRYMTTLQEDTTLAGDSLVSAVRDQASHYKRFYDIEVEVRCESEVLVNSQLAGAILQLVSEGLSNILRHTKSKRAFIALHTENHRVRLDIGNETPEGTDAPAAFTPRSMTARTRSMGGTCLVEQDALGYTMVQIAIPF